MTALYERVFPKFMDSRGWKVLVECVSSVVDPRIVDRLGVLTIQKQFDVPAFVAAEPNHKKRLTLGILWAGIVDVAHAEGWPLEPFVQARKAIEDRKFVNAWTWPKKPVVEPSTKRRAQLHCEHDVDAFRASLIVGDREGNELLRRPVLAAAPDEFIFVPKLGSLVWKGRGRVALEAKDGSRVGEVELLGLVKDA